MSAETWLTGDKAVAVELAEEAPETSIDDGPCGTLNDRLIEARSMLADVLARPALKPSSDPGPARA